VRCGGAGTLQALGHRHGDGRELRLAGIEAGDDNSALQTLPGGRPLRLERLGPEQDRYGRLVGFAFVGNAAQSVQQTLLEQGPARVSARVGDKACADALLHAEQAARAAKRGLWADPNFAPLSAENLDGLRAVRGRFTLVEGKVLSVRESGGHYICEFRAPMDSGLQRNHPAPPWASLRRCRPRADIARQPAHPGGGWVEQRGGPIIAAEASEQIEFFN
jgi:hypothetical protein